MDGVDGGRKGDRRCAVDRYGVIDILADMAELVDADGLRHNARGAREPPADIAANCLLDLLLNHFVEIGADFLPSFGLKGVRQRR